MEEIVNDISFNANDQDSKLMEQDMSLIGTDDLHALTPCVISTSEQSAMSPTVNQPSSNRSPASRPSDTERS